MIAAISQKLASSWPLRSALADAKRMVDKAGGDVRLAEKFEVASTALFVLAIALLATLSISVAGLDGDTLINVIALLVVVAAALALGQPIALIVFLAALVAFPLVFAPLLPEAAAHVAQLIGAFPLSEIAITVFLILLAAFLKNVAILLHMTGGDE